ncbi:MAG: phosphoadenylyl-sulfate reductase [Chloroflexota bacterium]
MVVESERVVFDEWEAGELGVEYDDQEPQEVIRWALETFAPERIAVCTSFQIDGMAILDMAWRVNPDVRVFTVDTGRMPRETHQIIEAVRKRYGMNVEIYHPDSVEIRSLVSEHGEDLFLKSVALRLTCCDVRKVRPLVKVLYDLDGWITGLRRDQWATRSNIKKIELDHDHGGIVKVNPLADWTEEEVWDYVRDNEVPYHSLYDQGYKSIGCAPCTRPVEPGADARSGRWWWETNAPKECGMHCAIETGGFEHELEVLVGDRSH